MTRNQRLIEWVHENGRPKFCDLLIFYLNEYGAKIPEYLDREGRLVNSKVYKSVGLSKDIFSKMVNKKDYSPDKVNACKIAFALHLNLEQTNYLLSRIGYVLSDCIKFDQLYMKYLADDCYDVEKLDYDLYQNGLKTFIGVA